MPVAQSRGHAGKALIVAGVGVAVALGLAFAEALLVNRGDVEINLGDDRFDAGQVESISDAIDEGDGLPLLYQDLVGRDRHIYVQHLTDAPDAGWVPSGAFPPAAPTRRVPIAPAPTSPVTSSAPSTTHPPTRTRHVEEPV